MAKAEWGTKRTCPKCGDRFYDLGNDDPVVCISCGEEFKPEPILKTKQPIVIEQEKESEDAEADTDDDLDLDDDDEAIGDVSLDDDDDEEVSTMVDTSLTSDES